MAAVRTDGPLRSAQPAARADQVASIRRLVLVVQSTSLGGMESHCVGLVNELNRRELEVMAIIPEGPDHDELERRLAEARATVRRVTTDARAGRLAQLRGLLTLAALFRAWHPDVVHLHTGGATGGIATVVLARALTRRAVVITEHDVPGENPRLRQRALRSAMDGSVDAIIAVSRRNARLRTQRIRPPGHKLAAVLNGVPTESVPDRDRRAANRRDLRAQLKIASDAVVIGSLVRLAEGKGLDDLIRAFAMVRDEHESTLLLVGDGPLRQRLESLADELAVSDHVHFAGHQPNAAPYLDAIDVFALAVPAGSMSMALLEAMARGLPSVITYCGPEEPVINGLTGLCAPPSNPEGLARVLVRLLRDPDLGSMLGAAGQAHVRRHFSVARVADDLLEIYAVSRGGSVPERMNPAHGAEVALSLSADPCAAVELNS